MTLGQRLDAAIEASGKSRKQIAKEIGIAAATISRITSGAQSPGSDLIKRLAKAIGVPVGSLYEETTQLSAADEEVLLHFRGWIDEKLVTIDARKEPNAILLQSSHAAVEPRAIDRVADRGPTPKQPQPHVIPDRFKRDGEQRVLLATGDSMLGAGILANDTLYTTAPVAEIASAIGKVVACNVAGATYVKRLVSEHRRLFLLSAHPRYAAIEVDEETDRFEILGIVIGRAGAIE